MHVGATQSQQKQQLTVEDKLTSAAGSHDHAALLGLSVLVHTELSYSQIFVLAIHDSVQLALDFKYSLLAFLASTTVNKLRLCVIRHLFVIAFILLVRG